MQSANRDYCSFQEKQTANSKSKLALPSVVTITHSLVAYVVKVLPVEPQQQATNQNTTTTPADTNCTRPKSNNECTENSATSAPALSTTTINDMKTR